MIDHARTGIRKILTFGIPVIDGIIEFVLSNTIFFYILLVLEPILIVRQIKNLVLLLLLKIIYKIGEQDES